MNPLDPAVLDQRELANLAANESVPAGHLDGGGHRLGHVHLPRRHDPLAVLNLDIASDFFSDAYHKAAACTGHIGKLRAVSDASATWLIADRDGNGAPDADVPLGAGITLVAAGLLL